LPDVIISADNVTKTYRRGDDVTHALKGVSIEVYRGEFLSIMGPSGSGKSTLFNQLGALDVPSSGKVYFEGQSLFDLSEGQQAWVRCNKIGYIFQTFNLVPVLSALQNVMLPLTFKGLTPAEAEEGATKVLKRVGLGERLHNKPFQLSGGQQQRVAIARALANTPDVVLADEPTGNLDTNTGGEIIKLLKSLNKENGVTVICSTHDPKMVAQSDRVCKILDGMIERISDAKDPLVIEFLATH
jgi:putative ABC transport system ATP-binding protein